ncbi:P-loop containing nucleoside triphosphate hydrolase protein [Lactarius hatsudake]|nr:P-loop containing nucleoside triphosphate hydrolase protein [Lactarius hatsudake]
MSSVLGFPLARLSLKVGCPVIFLRDVPDAPKGSRGIVTKTGVRVMEVRLLSGDTMLSVPRIPHEVEVTADLPFGRRRIRLRRLQFPVALGFAMTIDNAQGQTFSTVGVDLRSPCFAHGQLYLALSRASSSAGIKCIVTGTNRGECKTKNIVYREVVEALSQASSHRPPTHARSE